jgi:hypothetical protein
LEKKVAAAVQKVENTAGGDPQADYVTPLYPQKLTLTSPTSCGRSVGIVRSWTQATEFLLSWIWRDLLPPSSGYL